MRSIAISGREVRAGRAISFGIGVLLAAMGSPCLGDVVFRHFEFDAPRNFGYFVGDLVVHHVRLELSHPFRLDRSRLPKEGRVDLWLERDAPRVSEHRDSDRVRYEIELRYRVVNNPDAALAVFTPVVPLLVRGHDQSLTKDAPAWGFTLSPLALLEGSRRADNSGIRPDRLPPRLDRTSSIAAFVVTVVALVAALVYLFHAQWGIPGTSRRRLPFARALRDMRVLARQPADAKRYRAALRRFHQALNEVSGEAVFAGDLDAFFSGNPLLRPLRRRIEAVFERSAELFFADGSAHEPGADEFSALLELVYDCRRAER